MSLQFLSLKKLYNVGGKKGIIIPKQNKRQSKSSTKQGILAIGCHLIEQLVNKITEIIKIIHWAYYSFDSIIQLLFCSLHSPTSLPQPIPCSPALAQYSGRCHGNCGKG